MSFGIGDKVIFTNDSYHKLFPQYYPKAGTIGTVIYINDEYVHVQWPTGSVIADKPCCCSKGFVQKYKDNCFTTIENMFEDLICKVSEMKDSPSLCLAQQVVCETMLHDLISMKLNRISMLERIVTDGGETWVSPF